MSGDDRPTVPPVRLPSEAELARDALAAPLPARAAALARWAGTGVPVGAGGELPPGRLKEAAAHIAPDAGEEAPALAAEAWNYAIDTGLVTVDEEDTGADPDEVTGTAVPGEELARFTGGGAPGDVLEVWAEGLESVLADAATPALEDLIGAMEGLVREDGSIDPEAFAPESLQWDPEEEAAFLDDALENLYLLTATDEAVAAGAAVPLPVLAASLVLPEDMAEPSDEALHQVSAVMMKLDDQFRLLEPTGLLEYHPVDEALIAETSEEAPGDRTVDEEEDLTRYGQVRLTPLGLYGVRGRMVEAGYDAPLVGDLAGEDAAVLLAAVPRCPESSARAEAEQWLAARPPLEAARELLAAARGTDPDGPGRRLGCQLVLSLLGEEAEPALREVLDDRELGGLARVWLAERGADDIPGPPEDMVFWLTIDTLAAQLGAYGEEEEPAALRELAEGLATQHSGFFDKAWRVDHPATGDVLEAMGRVHPDRQTAKDARKAAFKARSRTAH